MNCYSGGADCEQRIKFSIENARMNPPERLQHSCAYHLTDSITLLMSVGGGPSYQHVVTVAKWGDW